MKYILIYLLISAFNALVVFLLITFIREGFYRIHKPLRPHSSKYLITSSNHIEIQGFNQCAGFSSAYLMRHYGKDVTGDMIYKNMPHLDNGTILPKHVVRLLRNEGFDAGYFRGSIDTLKALVEKGDPVIVFIRSSLDSDILHFVNVVGFDEENIFIVDSLENNINEPSEHYNRKVSLADFRKIWNTSRTIMPLHRNTFIKAEVKP